MEAKRMTLPDLFGRNCVLTPLYNEYYKEWGDHHWRTVWNQVRSAAEAELGGDTTNQPPLGRLSGSLHQYNNHAHYLVASGLDIAINIQILLVAAEDVFYYSPFDEDDAAFGDMVWLTSNSPMDLSSSAELASFQYKIKPLDSDLEQFDMICRTRDGDNFEACVWDPMESEEDAPMSYAFLYFREMLLNWVIAGSSDNYWPGSPVSESRIRAFREAIKSRVAIELNVF